MNLIIIFIFLFFIIRMGSIAKDYSFSATRVRISSAVFCLVTYAFMMAFQATALFALMKIRGIDDPDKIQSSWILEIISFIGGTLMISVYWKQLKMKMHNAYEKIKNPATATDREAS